MRASKAALRRGLQWHKIIQTLPVALRIEDLSEVKRKFMASRAGAGANSIGAVDDQPRALQDLLAGIEVVHANPAALQLYQATHVAGLSAALKVLRQTPACGALYRNLLCALADGHSGVERDWNIRLGNSSSIAVRTTAYKLGKAGKQWTRIVWIERDITAQKSTETELRLSEARLKVVVAHAPVAITLEDLDGNVLLANSKANEFFGSGFDAAVRPSRGVSAATAQAGSLAQVTERTLRTGMPVHAVIDLPGREGPRKGNLIKFPIAAGMDETIALGTICADVTEQRLAEEKAHRLAEELAHAERWVTVGQMSGALSHELNQPLEALLNYARAGQRLAGEGHEHYADLPVLLDKICGQAERMSQIIRNLRTFLGKKGTEMTEVDINAVVRNVLELANPSLTYHNIAVGLAPSEGLPPVRAGRISIEQAILNIVANAVDAMKDAAVESRRLDVWTRMAGVTAVEIGIADNGPGIAASVRDRLFEPFVTTKPYGTGLGLAICRSLLHQFGGSIDTRPAKSGATFVVRVPVTKSRDAGAT